MALLGAVGVQCYYDRSFRVYSFQIWKSVDFVRVRFLMEENCSREGGGDCQSNKFRMKKNATMKSFLWRSEEKFKTKQSSGRYEESVGSDQGKVYFRCFGIEGHGEKITPKTNHGEKEATSSDTLFVTDTLFLKAKICSGTNKDKVSNQQVLKTPAREGDKLYLTNEEVQIQVLYGATFSIEEKQVISIIVSTNTWKNEIKSDNTLGTSPNNFKDKIEPALGFMSGKSIHMQPFENETVAMLNISHNNFKNRTMMPKMEKK